MQNYVAAVVISLLSVVVTVLITALLLHKKRVKKLSDSIEKYLSKGILTDFNTGDNYFSALHNYVCDLENAIEAEKHNSAKEAKNNSEFISDISHQLKTPLAGIRLYCEMNHNESPDKYTEKELLLIERMEKLIYNLLKLEKLRADAYTMDFSECEIGMIVKDVVNELGNLFPSKNFYIKGNGMLRCDKVWMREAIANIVKNAAEHTPADGKIFITIEATGQSVIITIEDNGGGVPEEEIINLFTRFYKNADSPKNSAGIGMAVTKVIVEKHHGTVSALNAAEGLNISMCFPKIDGNLKI